MLKYELIETEPVVKCDICSVKAKIPAEKLLTGYTPLNSGFSEKNVGIVKSFDNIEAAAVEYGKVDFIPETQYFDGKETNEPPYFEVKQFFLAENLYVDNKFSKMQKMLPYSSKSISADVIADNMRTAAASFNNIPEAVDFITLNEENNLKLRIPDYHGELLSLNNIKADIDYYNKNLQKTDYFLFENPAFTGVLITNGNKAALQLPKSDGTDTVSGVNLNDENAVNMLKYIYADMQKSNTLPTIADIEKKYPDRIFDFKAATGGSKLTEILKTDNKEIENKQRNVEVGKNSRNYAR